MTIAGFDKKTSRRNMFFSSLIMTISLAARPLSGCEWSSEKADERAGTVPVVPEPEPKLELEPEPKVELEPEPKLELEMELKLELEPEIKLRYEWTTNMSYEFEMNYEARRTTVLLLKH